jgi:tetratricopeptide (TPR) repeat protein
MGTGEMMKTSRVFFAASLVFLWGGAAARAGTTATDQLLQFYQQRVARDPDDFSTYNRLGQVYLQKARETGELSYYDLAEKALRKSLELVSRQPAAVTAMTYLATVLFAKHQFQEALDAARQALLLDPNDLLLYAVVGDAYIELGEYERAAQAYERLGSQPDSFSAASRLAYLRFLRGDSQEALRLAHRATELAVMAGAPAENVAWTQTEQGQLCFHVGDLPGAETAYQQALKTYPGYHRALAGLAQVYAARRRYAEAIALYRQAIAAIPLPDYVAALGDVYAKIGSAEESKKQYDLVEYIAFLNTLNQTLYNRELALFYADHERKLPEALELARRELEVRKDLYTYDVLAWVLYKNGQPQEALSAMRRALSLGTQDARLFFHAGMIYHRLGQPQEAERYLQRALAVNPAFHIFQAEVAGRTLEALAAAPGPAVVRGQGR